MGLSKGLIDGRALFGKHARAVFGDVETVFEANTKLAVDDDGGLIAETHARLDFGLVAFHEVGPFVPVQADAVAGAMRQAGRLIARSEADVGDDFAGGRVHTLTGGAWFGSGQGGILRAALEVPYFALTRGGFSEDGGAGDVALV